jgi:N-acyl-D-amino-acid deacylase
MKLMRALLLFLITAISAAAAVPFDVVIRGGTIIDGTGAPRTNLDVAINGDIIVALGKFGSNGKRIINATNLVVAPGFIDIHSHSDWTLLEDGDAQSKIRQGVTTEVLGESTSPAPFQGQLPPRRVIVKDEPVLIRRLSDYLAAIERSGVSVNVASYVGEGQVWECVMGSSFERPTPAQFEKMKGLIGEAMEDGSFGLSSALMMPPSSLATTEDLIDFCKVVREHAGIFSTHMRDEGLGVFDSVKESIRISESAGVPVDILHVKIADQKIWGRMNEIVDLIGDARKRGVDVRANIYPYTRGNNDLASIVPPWAHEGGREKMLERLADPALRERLKREIREGLPGWYNHYTAVGGDWSRMLISANNPYKGMTMDRVIAMKSEGKNPAPDPLDIFLDLLVEQKGSVSTVYAHHTEEDMNLALKQPWTSIGSDGSALATEGILRRGNPHPRSFGTFPRVLGVYARERGLFKLEEAVRKMTSMNAAKLGLRDRGAVAAGMLADIVIFDPKTVADRATYEDPFQYPVGIEYVLVNGEVVIDKGKHTGARPGRALRHQRPLWTELRQVPTSNAGEGPAWNVAKQSIYFTGGDRVSYIDPKGVTHAWRDPAGGANGLAFDGEGRLVVCESQSRRITRTETNGSITVLADNFKGKKFNSPNDIAVDSKGRIYFTDPRYGPRDTIEMRDESGEFVEGVYRIDAPGEVARVIGRELERPNGIVVSPNDQYLFVADNNNNNTNGARKLWRFDLKPDGSVEMASRKLIFDWKTSRGPDGFKMDAAGRLFVAAGLNRAAPPFETVEPFPAGIYILNGDGRLLDRIRIPRDEVTNCAFGGPDLKSLYITAGGTLWVARVL